MKPSEIKDKYGEEIFNVCKIFKAQSIYELISDENWQGSIKLEFTNEFNRKWKLTNKAV